MLEASAGGAELALDREDRLPEIHSALLAAVGGSAELWVTRGRTVVSLDPVKTSGILVWITGLAPDQGRFAAVIGEVTVQGPS